MSPLTDMISLSSHTHTTARSKAANIARAASNIFSALVFGMIFFHLGNNQSSIQDRMGLLQVAAVNTAMSALIKTITVG